MASHKYRVTGEQPVVVGGKSYAKGEEFTAEFPPNDERVLLDSGAIEALRKDTKPDEKEG